MVLLVFLIIYAVGVVAVPLVMVLMDGQDPDPAVAIFGCFFGVFWPIYAPFVLLWWVAKGLARGAGRG